MMFYPVMFAIRGQTWFIIPLTLFKFVPVWPTVADGVVLQHVEPFDVLLIAMVSKTV